MQVEKSVARDRGGIYLWDAKPAKGGSTFRAYLDNAPAIFLFHPFTPILPKHGALADADFKHFFPDAVAEPMAEPETPDSTPPEDG